MLDLGRTFLQSVERRPRRLAIVDGEVRLTYAEWLERIARVAGGLAALGLGRGDHLVVVLQNRWEMATLHWACQCLGVIVTPLNWRAKADEVDYCVADAGARAIVFEPVSAQAVTQSAGAGGIARIAVDAAAADSATAGHRPTHTFEQLLESAPCEPLCAASAEDVS